MERTFHMLLYRAFHAQHNALRPYLAKLGLGFGQPKILGYLSRNGASSQRQLADYYDCLLYTSGIAGCRTRPAAARGQAQAHGQGQGQ